MKNIIREQTYRQAGKSAPGGPGLINTLLQQGAGGHSWNFNGFNRFVGLFAFLPIEIQSGRTSLVSKFKNPFKTPFFKAIQTLSKIKI